MTKKITFSELRNLKNNLPQGSVKEIANRLNINPDTVRNYFGGKNYKCGECVGIHIERGPNGGIVILDDDTIFNMAQEMLQNNLN